MSRPREFDETEVLNNAMHVFWKHGYAGTNLPDLLDAMSLTRGSFYQAFESKHKTYLRAISHYDETRISRSIAELQDASAGAAHERLVKFFMRTVSNPSARSPNMGCFICNTMIEMAPFDAECAAKCDQVMENLRKGFQNVIREILPDATDEVLQRRAVALQRLYMGSHAMGRMGATFEDWSELLDEIL